MTSEHPTRRSAAQRLRAMADAIDYGTSLPRAAAQFRVPKRALRQVLSPGNGPQLRAMAEAFENGNDVTGVAAQFQVPMRALQRIVSPKRSLQRPSKVISPEILAKAVELVRDGHIVNDAAGVLKVPLSSLTRIMLRHGFTVKRLRNPDALRDAKLDLAARQYQQGVTVAEISLNTGIPEPILREHFRRQRVPRRKSRPVGAARS